MTCFWDGIYRKLTDEDMKLINSNKKINIKEFINLLKKNNKICSKVKWQSEYLSDKLLKENFKMIQEYNINNINNGYLCSCCDPFIILICEIFNLNINHNYNNVNIYYTIKNNRKTLNYKSNKSHFF
uniref:Uncharacterized protein n=1 Tax=viral metagenome TaxID=1070528 RepID=A0A6C0C8Q9_9ZZZZ